ncbi:MAG: DNA alkylation response protein, partial [Burkholderiaceae bacterium]
MSMLAAAPAATHEVLNQSTPLVGHNLYSGDRALRDALQFHLPDADESPRVKLGALLGDAAMQTHARLANAHEPVLHTHDRFGHRRDSVEFHPSYHALLGAAISAGLHATPWAAAAGAHVEREGVQGGAHMERAAGFLMFTQLEPSVLCPVSMTYAVAPAL